jgi:mRNA interferase MazF
VELVIEQFGAHLVRLDPTVGSEIQKTRPCVVISPDDLNRHLQTALVAPLTATTKGYVSRVPSMFASKPGAVALDQIRCVDYQQFFKWLGRLDPSTSAEVLETLRAMFS